MSTKFNIPDAINDFDDVAGWIKDPPVDRPFANQVGNNGRSFCDAWSAAPSWAWQTAEAALPALKAGRKLADLACQPYLDDNGWDLPVFEPPFEGGQCTDAYQVRWDDGTGDRAIGGSIAGPLVRVFADLVVPLGSGPGGTAVYSIGATNAGGFTLASNNGTFSTTAPAVRVVNLTNIADPCGDPPGNLAPGAAPAPAPTDPGVGNRPGFNPSGQPFFFIPDTSGDGGDDLPFPTDPFGGGGGGVAPPTEPTPGDETSGEGSESGGGDNDFGEPPEGERWVACSVNLTAIPIGIGVIPSSLPEPIFAETVGNARLILQNGGTRYDTPIVIRSKTTMLWEPTRGAGLSGVRVNVRPFFGYSVRPFSIPLEQ